VPSNRLMWRPGERRTHDGLENGAPMTEHHWRFRRGRKYRYSDQMPLFPDDPEISGREYLDERTSGLPTYDPVSGEHYRDHRGVRLDDTPVSVGDILDEQIAASRAYKADKETPDEYIQTSIYTALGQAYEQKQDSWRRQLRANQVIDADDEYTAPFRWLQDVIFKSDVDRESFELADTELEREILGTRTLAAEWGWFSDHTATAIGAPLPEIIPTLWPLYVAFIDADRSSELLAVGVAELADSYGVDVSDWLAQMLDGVGAGTISLVIVGSSHFRDSDWEVIEDPDKLAQFVHHCRAYALEDSGDPEDWWLYWPQLWRSWVDTPQETEVDSWDFLYD